MDSRYNKLVGTSKITLLYIKALLHQGCKNNEIQRQFELWDLKNYFVITRVCYISVLYNESPLYITVHCNDGWLVQTVGPNGGRLTVRTVYRDGAGQFHSQPPFRSQVQGALNLLEPVSLTTAILTSHFGSILQTIITIIVILITIFGQHILIQHQYLIHCKLPTLKSGNFHCRCHCA